MGFTFRKLYPTVIEIRDCCNVECGCWVQVVGEGGDVFFGDGFTCRCPVISWPPPILEENVEECQNGECTECTFVINRCNLIGTGWSGHPFCFAGGFYPSCLSFRTVPCICPDGGGNGGRTYKYPSCIELPQDECCPFYVCRTVPTDYVGDPEIPPSGVIPLLEECTISGTKPHTYKFENIGRAPFACGISNSPQYPQFTLNGNSSGLSAVGAVGDPDLARDVTPHLFPIIRYYKVPSEENPIDSNYMVDFSRYCLKIHETLSQTQDIGNRTMVFAGRNVYRYTGVLSGDPKLASADPLWDDPGASGLRQLEESLGRSFPLPDRILTLPLWGETASDNMGLTGGGIVDNDGDPCTKQYLNCCGEDASPEDRCPVCVGCGCVSSDPYAATGHYLPNDQGYTAGYFSFSCFNPFAYLDNVDTLNNNLILAGVDNGLGFGSLPGAPDSKGYGCDDVDGNFNALNCDGFSGATSHGSRLGYPTCSLWSFIKATYSRVMKAFVTKESLIELPVNLDGLPTEANFRTEFPNFTAAIDNALASDPRGSTNNTSNVQFHLAKISDGLWKDTTSFVGNGYAVNLGATLLTFPNVFLWDKSNFLAASTNAERWQNLFIVGNANVLFDSGSFAVSDPAYPSTDDFPPATDDQDYRSFVITVDQVAHEKFTNVTGESSHARLVVFNGSHGPAGANRQNASSKISLTELPFCAGITSNRYPELLSNGYPPITICEICNAWPNSVCLTGTPESCGTVNGLNALGNLCIYPGGILFEGNCMTGNYQVPVQPSP